MDKYAPLVYLNRAFFRRPYRQQSIPKLGYQLKHLQIFKKGIYNFIWNCLWLINICTQIQFKFVSEENEPRNANCNERKAPRLDHT